MTIDKILEIAQKSEVKVEEIKLSQTYRFKTPELKHLEQNLYENNSKKYEKKI